MSDPDSGTFSPVETVSDVDSLFQELAKLRGAGRGYAEISLSDPDSAQLTVGFQEDHAVIHLISNMETFLPVGDSAAALDAIVEVPFMGELASFAGEFAVSLDRAWTVIQEFLGSGIPERVGEWRQL